MPRSIRLAAAAPVALVLALAAMPPASAQQDDPGAGVVLAATERIRAMVLTVDREAGQILMRNLDTGEVFVHEPPGEISGVLGVESGDVVEAIFTRGVTARPAEPGDPEQPERRTAMAPAGSERGAGFVGGTLDRRVVTFEAWNPETEVAVVRAGEGRVERYRVQSPEARAFVEALEPGERIEVEISETVVVTRPDR